MGLGHLLELSHSPLRSHLETRDGGMGAWASPAHGSEGARSPKLVFADAVFPVQQPLHEELNPFRDWSVPPGNYTHGVRRVWEWNGGVWGGRTTSFAAACRSIPRVRPPPSRGRCYDLSQLVRRAGWPRVETDIVKAMT